MYDRDLEINIGYEPRARPLPRITIDRQRCGCAYRVSALAHLSTRTLLRQCRKHRLADTLQDLWIITSGRIRWCWRDLVGGALFVLAMAALAWGMPVLGLLGGVL